MSPRSRPPCGPWAVLVLVPVLVLGAAGCGPATPDGGADAGDRPAGCGDGVIAPGELCDGAALGGASCASLGLGAGELRCAADCRGHDASGCEAVADAPVIVQLATNVTTLAEGDRLVVTAIVTDPQGVDDVIGGSLTDPAGASYGAFATAASEGSYALELTWWDLAAIRPITGPEDRVLVATFFDQAAHRATATVTVSLSLGTCAVTSDCAACLTCATGECAEPAVAPCEPCDGADLGENECALLPDGTACCRAVGAWRLRPCAGDLDCASGFRCATFGPPDQPSQAFCYPDAGTCDEPSCQ